MAAVRGRMAGKWFGLKDNDNGATGRYLSWRWNVVVVELLVCHFRGCGCGFQREDASST